MCGMRACFNRRLMPSEEDIWPPDYCIAGMLNATLLSAFANFRLLSERAQYCRRDVPSKLLSHRHVTYFKTLQWPIPGSGYIRMVVSVHQVMDRKAKSEASTPGKRVGM